MPPISRRDFLAATSAAALASAASPLRSAPPTTRDTSFTHRVQFGAWINDMRNFPLPRDEWPSPRLDDDTERDILNCLDVGHHAGFNQLDVWGLFATSSYPIDIRSAFQDPARRPRVDRILAHARSLNTKILFGTGVYSWGFDTIIQQNPSVRGTNPKVMCANSPDSLAWQQKLIDTIVSELHVDGFHLESADQGRCTCPRCAPLGDVEYHALVTTQTADYIRAKYPTLITSCVIQGWSPWGKPLSPDDKQRLVSLSNHVDVIWDQGHRQTYIPAAERKSFIASLSCDYGTSGGFWIYPPQRWNRLRWFFPYVQQTGSHIQQLFADGGRGVMFYQGPTTNPGVEVTLSTGGRLLANPAATIEDTLSQTLQDLFRPKTDAALRKLTTIFLQPEQTYFANWQRQTILDHDHMPLPGELHLTPLFGTTPGGPTYLTHPFLNPAGRDAYRASLLTAYDTLTTIESDLADAARTHRLSQCLASTLADLDTLALGKAQPN